MQTIMKFIFPFLIFVGASSAQAGFHIDPSVGYILVGSADTTFPSGITSDNDFSGLQLGTRVGWSLLGFTFGAEYQFGTVDADGPDIDVTALGAFAGYELPILVRGWLTYVLDTSFENNTSNLDGDGFKIGVGYMGFPFLSLNLEHAILNYSGTVAGSSATTDVTMTMFSVSMPFTM